MKDILQTITECRIAKKWTEYQLAEKSGLPQSTISSWYRKNLYPTMPSLIKICDALGITLVQLFNNDDKYFYPTNNQKKLLEKYDKLTIAQQKALLNFLDTI